MNTQKGFFLFMLCLLVFAEYANARPKIGLVLGGGGAKGGAHLGVLKVLERENIPIDYIAGTSIGSMIGGFFALGYSAVEIVEKMQSINWEEGYSDTIPREALPYRMKQRDQFNFPLNIGHEGYSIKTPSGLLYGQKASMLLRDAFGNIAHFSSFDDLPIPYRAIATDLSTNAAVVLDKGDLLLSMRASSNVPGILAPVKFNGKLLVDGGMANNLPIDIVKNMGADIIIAIDIGDPLAKTEDLNDTFTIIGQLSSFLTVASTEKQKSLLTESDILIKPNIEHLSTTDWSKFAESIDEGEKAALAHLSFFKELSLPDIDYQYYLEDKQRANMSIRQRMAKPVTEIVLNNQSRVYPELILDSLSLDIGETLSESQLNNAIDKVYSLDEFQFVSIGLEEKGTGRALIFETQEKSWGPNFFEFGLGWETNFTDESSIDLDFAYTVINLTRYGGEWRSQLELGNEPALSSELYVPLTSLRSFFSRSVYSFESFNWAFGSTNTFPVTIEQDVHQIRQGLGWNFSRHGLLEMGALAELGFLDNDFLLAKAISYDSYGAYLTLGFDDLDSSVFPTEGKRFLVTLKQSIEDVDNANFTTGGASQLGADALQLNIEWKGALNLGSHAFVSKADFTRIYVDDGEESVHLTQLGGFLNLSGYNARALSGPNKLFGALIYQYNLRGGMFKKTQLPFYLGLSAEAGNVWSTADEINVDDLIFAGSVYLGTDTKMGPVALGYGFNEESQKSVYFYLGYKL
jgi:NTE family protein